MLQSCDLQGVVDGSPWPNDLRGDQCSVTTVPKGLSAIVEFVQWRY